MPRIVTFGEIMARLETSGFQRFRQALPGNLGVTFAGAEASIAVSFAHLGGDAAFVTALPQHELADACVANLKSFGVDTRDILRTEAGRLGLYFLEHGVNQRPAKVIYDRAGSAVAITAADQYDWDAIFADADWLVISGITPAISENAAEVSNIAVAEATRRSIRIACDMNYRSKLWQWDTSKSPRELAGETMRHLLPSVEVLIAGADDLVQTLGYPQHDKIEELLRPLLEEFPKIQRVAMSRRESLSAHHQLYGGLLYDRVNDAIYTAPGNQLYEINPVVDRLGAGDAFTAGLLFALTTPELSSPDQMVQFATAAGCLAHSIEGDYHLSTRAEIEALMQGDSSGRVQR